MLTEEIAGGADMERLDKILAGTGRWSRREVKELVRQGRVRVDGQTARTAEEKVAPEAAAITVDGQPVETERFTYVMLHKPAGVLSATPLFVLINSYTTGLAPSVLGYLLHLLVAEKYGGTVSWDELGLPVTATGMALPCGATGRWFSE